MAGDVLNPLLALAAGALTILSPCVLPLVPVVLGAAAQRHRLGPLALAGGLVVSFTTVGFLLGVFGSRLGVDADQLRVTGAIMLVASGAFLLLPSLQNLAASAAAPLMGWAGAQQQRFDDDGLLSQGAIGILLGLVWSPCAGPTLGAATALAAQGQNLGRVALTMAGFACGIAVMLLAIAFLGRRLLFALKDRVAATARIAKGALGATLALVGVLILTGFDRTIEAALVLAAPDWLNQLTSAI